MAQPQKTPAPAPAPIRVEFTFERQTKNTFLFTEVAPDGEKQIGALYIQKSAFGAVGAPAKLVVTVEPQE